MNLKEFMERVNECERQEKFEKHKGLTRLIDMVDGMGRFQRLRMRCLIWWYTKGEVRKGLLGIFIMHKKIMSQWERGVGLPHADGD